MKLTGTMANADESSFDVVEVQDDDYYTGAENIRSQVPEGWHMTSIRVDR